MPIGPEEVAVGREIRLPSAVSLAFDQLIREKFDGHSAYIELGEAINRITHNGAYIMALTDQLWRDIEEAYRQSHWIVEPSRLGSTLLGYNFRPTYTVVRKNIQR